MSIYILDYTHYLTKFNSYIYYAHAGRLSREQRLILSLGLGKSGNNIDPQPEPILTSNSAYISFNRINTADSVDTNDQYGLGYRCPRYNRHRGFSVCSRFLGEFYIYRIIQVR